MPPIPPPSLDSGILFHTKTSIELYYTIRLISRPQKKNTKKFGHIHRMGGLIYLLKKTVQYGKENKETSFGCYAMEDEYCAQR